MAEVKCPICNKKFDRDVVDNEKIGNRYFHLECAEKYYQQKAMEEKQQEEQRATEKDRRELLSYIAELQGVDFVDGLVMRLVKNLHDEGYSYKGIKSTLQYFYEIMGNPVRDDNNVLGIVPYVYSKAMKYWIEITQAWKANDEFLAKNKPFFTEHKVRIKAQKRQGYLDNRMIDIESI